MALFQRLLNNHPVLFAIWCAPECLTYLLSGRSADGRPRGASEAGGIAQPRPIPPPVPGAVLICTEREGMSHRVQFRSDHGPTLFAQRMPK